MFLSAWKDEERSRQACLDVPSAVAEVAPTKASAVNLIALFMAFEDDEDVRVACGKRDM